MQLISEAYTSSRRPRPEQRATRPNLHRVEQGRTRFLPDRNHLQHLQVQGPDGSYLVDKILDAAGQKGTGKWTVLSGLDNGAPVTLIAEAVFARIISSLKDERVAASTVLAGPTDAKFTGDAAQAIEDVRQALYASKIISYAQGYMLMRRSPRVQVEAQLRRHRPDVARRLHHPQPFPRRHQGRLRPQSRPDQPRPRPFFTEALKKAQGGWRRTVALGATLGIPTPTFSNALAFLRFLPLRPAARQPAPGPARLFRRPHLRAHRQAAASSSTPTGPAVEAVSHPRRITFKAFSGIL
jgi:6-phosphogluconate dehydrogenase